MLVEYKVRYRVRPIFLARSTRSTEYEQYRHSGQGPPNCEQTCSLFACSHCSHRTVRTTNSANSSHCANSANGEQCEQLTLCEQCEQRTVRTAHIVRTVRTTNSANSSNCPNSANRSHRANSANGSLFFLVGIFGSSLKWTVQKDSKWAVCESRRSLNTKMDGPKGENWTFF